MHTVIEAGGQIGGLAERQICRLAYRHKGRWVDRQLKSDRQYGIELER